MHLVEAGGQKLLLDCGLARGSREVARQRNSHFPFSPAEIDAVILSHAHIDHCGNLPNLVRQGFRGPIYCTPPTRELLGIVQRDSARIQEEEAFVLNVLDRPEEVEALFTYADARQMIQQCVAVPYRQPTEITGGFRLHFSDAGHILGSAVTSMTIPCQHRDRSLTFTGDIGRRGLPYLPEPAPLPAADLIISECTYGGGIHPTLEQIAKTMTSVIRRTIARGGKVLIPAFSLGRTQLITYYLQVWMREGRIPEVPIFIDSPLAVDLAEVHRRYAGHLIGEAACLLREPVEMVHYASTYDESQELAGRRGPCIVIAASGMCEGGRILRHLKENIDDPRASILLVSYQAPGTIGNRLLEPKRTLRFHGRDWNFWAEVVNVQGLSGHADQNDLLSLLAPLAHCAGQVALVHGEVDRAELLASALREQGFARVAIPVIGETLRLE